MNRMTRRVTIPCFTKALLSFVVFVGVSGLVIFLAYFDGFSASGKATWLSFVPWLVFAMAFFFQYFVVGPCLQVYCAQDGTWMVSLVQRTLRYLRAVPVLLSFAALLLMPPGIYYLVSNMMLSDELVVQSITSFGVASYLFLLCVIVRQLS